MSPTPTGEDANHSRKRSRRDEKGEKDVHESKPSNRNTAEIGVDRHSDDRDRRHQRRSRISPSSDAGMISKGPDRKAERPPSPSDPKGALRSRSHFQQNERNSAGHGDRSYVHRAPEHARWSDPKKQPLDKVRDKAGGDDLQKKDEKPQPSADDKNKVWRHDGYYELEVEAPPAKKRPAFREKKIQVEGSADGATESESVRPPRHDRSGFSSARREEVRGYNPRGSDRYGRPFTGAGDKDLRRGDGVPHRTDVPRYGYQSRERYGSGTGARGRDRYNARNSYGAGGFQVEKWKHDMFDEANKSPSPKNEEDQIAKVEALLAS